MSTYFYCPFCGSSLEKKVRGDYWHYTCQNGHLVYENSKPAVGALIEDDRSRVLLTRRAHQPYQGHWDIPGGFLEVGELPEDGIRRELNEELNITSVISLEFYDHVIGQYGPNGDNVLNIFFVTKVDLANISVHDDVDAYQWFELDNLPENLAFPINRIVLEKYCKTKRSQTMIEKTSGAAWQDALYEHYVSSGQSGSQTTTSADKLFASRKPFLDSLIKSHIPPDRASTILDLGCGHGAILYALKQHGYQNIRGIDISGEQIALAHKLGIDEAIQAEVRQFVIDLPSESQDVVLLIDILEHLERQAQFDLLSNVSRVLRSGGKCVLHVPNAEGLFGMRVRYGDLTHELAFTPTSMRQLLAVLGFEQIRSYEDKPHGRNINGIVRHLVWEISTLFFRLMLMAETGATAFVLSQNMFVTAIKP